MPASQILAPKCLKEQFSVSPSWLAFPPAEEESRAVKLRERIVTAPPFRLVFLTSPLLCVLNSKRKIVHKT